MTRWIGKLAGSPLLLSLLLAPALAACASAKAQRPRITIQVIQDSVRFRRSAEGAELNAVAVLRNRTGQAIYYRAGCGTALQRQVDRSWQTVWNNQLCVGGLSEPVRVASGDSLVVSANFHGFTTRLPGVDPRVVPGRYRLVLAEIGFELHPTSHQIRRALAEEARSSLPFVVELEQ